ncbi:MAG: SDR family NAD(P)-dependent oxidoreductase [Anaerolineae bacterium]|uniref:SDR family NAD(P)-dependent oxidoreductase n=1 Tax=Candidatus Amarolinea dominans TaxID=3140696 RepID=UPI0031355644|nr:SDR family NAD(P)-dependent oxidoreductase [Anaerolineae bacterium]
MNIFTPAGALVRHALTNWGKHRVVAQQPDNIERKLTSCQWTHRVAMITGGNSGIGFATASKLAAHGFHVVMASRNQQTSARRPSRRMHARHRTPASSPSRSTWRHSHRCGSALLLSGQGYSLRLDQQRGGSIPGKQARFTADGFELTFGTNHLRALPVSNLLLDDPDALGPGARLVRVSSQLHIPGYAGGKPPVSIR